jgi:quaternary ammonium compound-resistance protein SugE
LQITAASVALRIAAETVAAEAPLHYLGYAGPRKLHLGCIGCTPDLPARRPLLKRQSEHQTRGDEMAWVALLAAGLFETAFAVCLKLSDGLRALWPTVGFALSALASFGLLTVALRDLDVGPAYAVWTGIGAAGAATFGMVFLGDAVSTVKLVSIALILAGVAGLNLSGVTP